MPVSASARRRLLFPGEEPAIPGSAKCLHALTEHDVAHIDDAAGKPLRRVPEGAHVGLDFRCAGMKRGGDIDVSGLETGNADDAGTLQQRGVGAYIEIDFALAGATQCRLRS